MISVLLHFIRGAAQTVAESRRAGVETGVPDQDWWAARSGLLAQVAPDFADRFPAYLRLHQPPAEDAPPATADRDGPSADAEPAVDADAPYLERAARETFEAGLAMILDGVEKAVGR